MGEKQINELTRDNVELLHALYVLNKYSVGRTREVFSDMALEIIEKVLSASAVLHKCAHCGKESPIYVTDK